MHIGGKLNFDGATLRKRSGGGSALGEGGGGEALRADRLRVDQGMFCRNGFNAEGELRLPRALIGGQLSFRGAKLSNRGGRALYADGLRVDQNMSFEPSERKGDTEPCRPFCAEGELRLRGAHIGGELNADGAQLTNEPRWALNADRLQVDQDMSCGERSSGKFSAQGGVSLLGARIGGWLDFSGAILTKSPTAVSLQDAEVAALGLRFAERPDGVVDLRRVGVGAIQDRAYGERGSWPKTRLKGCRYESLEASPPVDVETRLLWVQDDPDDYSPQPYEQLSDVYRRAGHEEDARDVAIAKQRRRRKELPPPARALSFVLDAAVGYGYRTWRAVYALLGVMAIGWGVFAWASWAHFDAIKSEDHLPRFAPWLYSIDSVLPVINLGQESAWAPTGAAQYWYAFSVLAGWLLSLGLVAALTAALFRE